MLTFYEIDMTYSVCYVLYCIKLFCWPAQPGNPSAIRVASVIGFSVFCSLFSVLCLPENFFLILLQWCKNIHTKD